MPNGIVERSQYGTRLAFTVIDSRLEERAALVANSALFAGLSHPECYRLAQAARIREFLPDHYLFEQGQPVRQALLLETGCVKLTQISSNGSEVILWLYGAGDAAGILGCLAGFTHTCNARVMVKSRALVWDWAQLNATAGTALIQRNISSIVAKRMGELEERFREIATENVAKRVACALARIMKQVGHVSAEGIEILLSREELAQLTGTTIYSISRLISRWGEQGIVLPRREAIVVRDPNRLIRIGLDSEEREDE